MKTAVEQNLPIKGTPYFHDDIVDKNDESSWNPHNYGIHLDRPGGQEYYDSVIELLAEWGVDFIKFDDIVPYPAHIEAVAKAIEKSGRDIVFSLSPGGENTLDHIDYYRMANMVRVSYDIWDKRESLDWVFGFWEIFRLIAHEGCWIDMDMLPLGHLKCYNRYDKFTESQRETFMAQRALGASPLIMGGALPSTPDSIYELITDPDMLECNQNGVVGELVYRKNGIDIWHTPHKKLPGKGWLGIFNRKEQPDSFQFDNTSAGLEDDTPYGLWDIWKKTGFASRGKPEFEIEADGVVFIRYQSFLTL